MKQRLLILIAVIFVLAAMSVTAFGFGEIAGQCGADCAKCHQLTKDEAVNLIRKVNPDVEVMAVQLSPVGGLWEVTLSVKGKKGIAYLDFGKRHIVSGPVIEISSGDSITNRRLYDISRVDPALIPVRDTIVMGKEDAKYRVIIFDDPECPFCKQLHQSVRQIVDTRDDIVFFIKMLPLKIHPDSYKKAKSIVCDRSLKLLERSFDGKPVPAPTCETSEVDETIALAEKLGIRSTPTIILPDGGVVPGYKDAAELVKLIESSKLVKPKETKKK